MNTLQHGAPARSRDINHEKHHRGVRKEVQAKTKVLRRNRGLDGKQSTRDHGQHFLPTTSQSVQSLVIMSSMLSCPAGVNRACLTRRRHTFHCFLKSQRSLPPHTVLALTAPASRKREAYELDQRSGRRSQQIRKETPRGFSHPRNARWIP